MRLFRALALILTAVLFFQCQREISFIGGPDPQPAIPAPITAIVQGNVMDENGQPAQGVDIKVGTKTAITDVKGYFRIKDAALDKNASFVIAEKTGYFKAMRTFSATSGVNQVVIKLTPKSLAGTVDGAAGGAVTLNSGMKVALPANGVVVASTGSAHTGTVNVYAAYIDPTSPQIDRIVPGSFMADDKNGGRVTLSSYGMMAVELESSTGEKLQVKSGSKATLTAPIPASLQASAPDQIAMWYVDEARGIWKEEGSGSKIGSSYVGEVSHFSFWNYDISIPAVTLTATMKNGDGDILVHARVRVKTNTPYPTQAGGYTDSLGQVSGLVPANQPLVLEVLDECNGIIYSKNITALSQNTNLGSITISAASSASLVTVKGRLLNCTGAPVSNGHAIIVYGNMVRYDEVDANGNFTTNFTRCSSSPLDFLVTGVDVGGQQQGPTISGTISGNINNVGDVSACGVSTSQFISYTLDGTSQNFVVPGDSLTTYAYPDSLSSTWITFISGSRVSGGALVNSIDISFDHPSQINGTYPVQYFSTMNYPQATIVQPFNVVITNYPTAAGQFLEGTFSGNFNAGGATHTVTNGSFRIRRIF